MSLDEHQLPARVARRMGVGRSPAFRMEARALLRRPLFLTATLLTIALGIGTNAGVSGAALEILAAPLPYPDEDRLVRLFHDDDLTFGVSLNELQRYRRSLTTLEDAGGWLVTGITLNERDGSARLVAARVTTNLFDVLGRSPEVGSGLAGAGPDAVLISHRLWENRFGGRDAIGRTLRLDGEPRVVVGVLPPDVAFPDPTVDVYLPISPSAPSEPGRGSLFLDVVGRLRPGRTLAAASAEVNALARAMRAEDRAAYEAEPDFGGHVAAFREIHVRGDRPLLAALVSAAGLLFLATCLNIGTLLAVRAEGRSNEMALRRALGAGPRDLARLHLADVAILTTAGGLLGSFVGVLVSRVLTALAPEGLLLGARSLEPAVLGATPVITLAAFLLVGLLMLPRLRREWRGRELAQDRGASSRLGAIHRLLPAAQIALALVLLSGAILLLHTVGTLTATDLGYDTRHVLSARVPLSGPRYASAGQRGDFFERLVQRVAAYPGVTAAGVVNALPLSAHGGSGNVTVEAVDPDAALAVVTQRLADPGYFRAMGIPLVAGRPFTPGDREGAPRVVLVDEVFARRFFGEPRRALNQRIKVFFGGPDWNEIVGVVGHVRHGGPAAGEDPHVYVPVAQRETGSAHVVARHSGSVAAVATAVRAAVSELDPAIPVYDIASMEERLRASLARERFAMTVFSLFSLLALVLAAVGVYGVVALVQERRTREVGIRRALGASGPRIVWTVAGSGLAGLPLGLAGGAGGALALDGYLRTLLPTLRGSSAAPLAAAAALLLLVGVAAAWVPVRRALRVNCASLMRSG